MAAGQSEEVLRPHGLSGGAMTWVDRAASHVEVAAELGHQRLAAEAESHPSSRQEGGGQSRALGCGTQIQQEGQETGVLE